MELPRERLTTRRLMMWGIVVAVWLAIVRTYLVAARNAKMRGRLSGYREAEKVRALTKSEAQDAARLAEELSQAGN